MLVNDLQRQSIQSAITKFAGAKTGVRRSGSTINNTAIVLEETATARGVVHRQRGFTLVKWLIIVAVLAIIVGIAVVFILPAYKTHTIQPKFAEVTRTLAPYKAAIETCAKNGSCVVAGSLAGLKVGVLGVPPSISTTYLARVVVSPNGVITATASNAGGLAGETFVLTPGLSNGGQITWTVSGSCKTRSTGAIC